MKFYEDPQYIKMCEKAKEVQDLQPTCEFSLGNFYRYGNFPDDFYKHTSSRYDPKNVFCRTSTDTQEYSVWLPRQDQLQELYSSDLYTLLHDFERWIERGDSDSMNCSTMEQLWLSFIMRKKFNKTWTGEDWK